MGGRTATVSATPGLSSDERPLREAAEWVTTIVGLKAVADNPRVHTWFIVLRDRRVGADVRLMNETMSHSAERALRSGSSATVSTLRPSSESRVNDGAVRLPVDGALRDNARARTPTAALETLGVARPGAAVRTSSPTPCPTSTTSACRRSARTSTPSSSCAATSPRWSMCATASSVLRPLPRLRARCVLARGQHTATTEREMRSAGVS